MEEHLKCPICFEIPEKEIYQCISGHTVCETCIANLKLCPQCREPFGSIKIRNRALEQILDAQKFDCHYKDKGCNEKLKRLDITQHAESCPKKPIPLCQILGYQNCKHVHDTSNRSVTIKHLEEHHGAVNEPGREVIVRYPNMKLNLEAGKNNIWSPVLLQTNESVFFITCDVDSDRQTVSWRCLQIFGSAKYTMKFWFTNLDSGSKDSKKSCYSWKIPVFGVSDPDMKCPMELSFHFIQSFLNDEMDLSVSFLVQSENSRQSKNSIPEVWAFSTQVEKTKDTDNTSSNVAGSVEFYDTAACNECNQVDLERGHYYKCLECHLYDICGDCMEQGIHSNHKLILVSHLHQY